MSNYFEYHDTVAFHPGYYIKEIIDNKGMTQEEFARRLGTTPKNLSLLLRGEQSLSIEIAMKLSRLLGTSIMYWLNLQNVYDALLAEYKSDQESAEEMNVMDSLGYKDFVDLYSLPDVQTSKERQLVRIREYLNIASLTQLKDKNSTAAFHTAGLPDSDERTIRANAVVQVAVNRVLETANSSEVPHYSKTRFRRDAQRALSLTSESGEICLSLQKTFLQDGVIFIILPVLAGADVTGAVRKVGNQILLMISDKCLSSDVFWYGLYQEIGNILFGNYGITFANTVDAGHTPACRYAEDALLSPELYQNFISIGHFDAASIRAFSDQIGRTPGIVLGRLRRDGYISSYDQTLQTLLRKYTAVE